MKILRAALVFALLGSTQAKKGGGSHGGGSSGGGSGGSSSGGDSGGSSGGGSGCGSSNSGDLPGVTPQYQYSYWLYRWTGTYYKGTIDISMKFSSPCTSSNQDIHVVYDGVLSLIDKKYQSQGGSAYTGPDNPFGFYLDGWNSNNVPPDTLPRAFVPFDISNFTDVPAQVQLDMGSYPALRVEENSAVSGGLVGSSFSPCTLTLSKESDGYGVSGLYKSQSSSGHFLVSGSSCNGSSSDLLFVQNFVNSTALYAYQSVDNSRFSTISGDFSPSVANLTWHGTFVAQKYYDSMGSSASPSMVPFEGVQPSFGSLGEYTIKFTGNVFQDASHAMNIDGPNVTWTEDATKLAKYRVTTDIYASTSTSTAGSSACTSGGPSLTAPFIALVIAFGSCIITLIRLG